PNRLTLLRNVRDVRTFGTSGQNGVGTTHVQDLIPVKGNITAQIQLKIGCRNGPAIQLKLVPLIANFRVAQISQETRCTGNSRYGLVEQQVIRVAEVSIGDQLQTVFEQAHI